MSPPIRGMQFFIVAALVLSIEGSGHRCHVSLVKRDLGERLQTHQISAVSNDLLRRGGFIVTDIDDAA